MTTKGKSTIRSITPNNLQQCLESMHLDFSKYDKYKVQNQREKELTTIVKMHDHRDKTACWTAVWPKWSAHIEKKV